MWVGVDWTGRENGGEETVEEAEVEGTGFVDQTKEFVLYYSKSRTGLEKGQSRAKGALLGL